MNFKVNVMLMFLILVVATTSCSDKRTGNTSVVLSSYRLIDSGRTNEAIELLEAELETESSVKVRYDINMALASAYAHKSGINIQSLIPVLKKAETINTLKKTFSDEPKNNSTSAEVNMEARRVSYSLIKVSQAFEAYASIPVISVMKSNYIRKAIEILEEPGSSVNPEDALYRALIKIILFKHLLAENLLGEFIQPKNTAEECRINLGAVNDDIIELGKVLIDVFNDIGFANGSLAEDMRVLSEKTAEMVSSLTLGTTSLIVIDEASSVFFRRSIIENGFGKIIKCGAD
ncbi:MAG: hypothetical protein HOO06_03625 [Bdellovibrionaceae bacterium]|nr:hypothetical protein [Pseudobdellovibrionaceae bacterium]